MEHNLNIPTNFVSSAVHSTLQKANNIYADIIKAEQRIRKYLAPTPLVYSPYLSAKVNANLKSGSSNPCRVFLKLESENVTGSFKVRGAFNKVLISKEKGSALDFTTASTGNHAAAVVHVLQTFNYKGDIYIPYNAAKVKVTKLQQMIGSSSHISLIRFGDDCLQAELEARRQAQARNATYISPYNDYDVMVGQGTIGVEISAQLAQWSAKDNHGVSIPDYVIVPVGGGGLIGGITSFFKQQPKSQLAQSHTKIIGCQPANDNAMYQSVKAGRIVDIAVCDAELFLLRTSQTGVILSSEHFLHKYNR
jgi:threonine dehydratase